MSVPVVQLDGARRLLLVKPSALGDVVHALPVAATLKRRYPHLALDWLVEEEAAEIVAGHPALAGVVVSGRRRWLGQLRDPRRVPATLREMRALLMRLREARYDAVLDLQGLLKSAIYTLATRAPVRVGFAEGREGAPRALTHRVPAPPQPVHAVDRYLALAAAVDAAEPVRDFTIATRRDDQALARGILAGLPRPRVVLHPGARWPTKLWEPEHWRALASALLTGGGSVLVTGSAQDAGLADAIVTNLPGPGVSLAGRLSLKGLAALLAEVDVAITVDSGPMHVAAAVGTPLVALFGPTDPRRTGPYGNGRVLRHELSCSPCLKRHCAVREHRQCMRALTVSEVLAAAQPLLAARAGARPGCPA